MVSLDAVVFPFGTSPSTPGPIEKVEPPAPEEAVLIWGKGGSLGQIEQENNANVGESGFKTHNPSKKKRPDTFTFTEVSRKEIMRDYTEADAWIRRHYSNRATDAARVGAIPLPSFTEVIFEGPKRVRGGFKNSKTSESILEGNHDDFFQTRKKPDKQLYRVRFLLPDPWHKIVDVRASVNTTGE